MRTPTVQTSPPPQHGTASTGPRKFFTVHCTAHCDCLKIEASFTQTSSSTVLHSRPGLACACLQLALASAGQHVLLCNQCMYVLPEITPIVYASLGISPGFWSIRLPFTQELPSSLPPPSPERGSREVGGWGGGKAFPRIARTNRTD